MEDQELYVVRDEMWPKLSPWFWHLVCRRIGGPTPERWLQLPVAGVRAIAAAHGLTLIGDPIPKVERRGRRVVLAAEAMALGRPGLTDRKLSTPTDVVDQ